MTYEQLLEQMAKDGIMQVPSYRSEMAGDSIVFHAPSRLPDDKDWAPDIQVKLNGDKMVVRMRSPIGAPPASREWGRPLVVKYGSFLTTARKHKW